ncbi:sensor histidine kinase [Oceanibium sediminis]|uniref:sensor histidine kinase n=1 Tax=Oceanibium sediminis TaxID=2026339 RepID=UPI000DD4967C|nr:sensor histidine kinase [Oceanibium sediminis]
MFGRRPEVEGSEGPFRIILSHPDYEESEPERRGSEDLLDWTTRFGRRSPLSRKIITFNLVALGVLLAGVLYLNQFQGGMLELRTRSLVTEANLLSDVLSEDIEDVGVYLATERLQNLAPVITGRVAFYDTDLDVLQTVTTQAAEGAGIDAVTPEDTPRQSAFISIMSGAWDRLSRIFAARQPGNQASLTTEALRPLIRRVLAEGEMQISKTSTLTGDKVVSVALPVTPSGGGPAVGVLLVSTIPGDIDSFIRAEREQILQVFALAIITSIFLSLVLANTIVRPLRDLSEAAHEGGTRNARQVNPERINIPDMSGRPDEIGYLSSTMRLMTAALFDRIEANESFAADVAHEIKNPLTSLRSAVETMPYAKTEENRARLAEVIKQDVNRLDRLVTDISNASRLDSELVRDQMVSFDLHQQLSSLISYNETQAKAVGATLKGDLIPEPLMITGMEGRLAQVFVNLITNALSFAGEGDAILIRTEVLRRSRVRIYVEDEGPGIPDDNLQDVFKRFYSQRPEAEAFGNHSGLGLAISRQIIVAHGGEIWAENIRDAGKGRDTPPKGARFVVELPL